MAERGVTIVTTGVDLDARTDIGAAEEGSTRCEKQGVPYMETVRFEGIMPLHLPHTARLPFFDATLDIIHASSSVDGMEYADFEDALSTGTACCGREDFSGSRFPIAGTVLNCTILYCHALYCDVLY